MLLILSVSADDILLSNLSRLGGLEVQMGWRGGLVSMIGNDTEVVKLSCSLPRRRRGPRSCKSGRTKNISGQTVSPRPASWLAEATQGGDFSSAIPGQRAES